jgi:hypothetical protein
MFIAGGGAGPKRAGARIMSWALGTSEAAELAAIKSIDKQLAEVFAKLDVSPSIQRNLLAVLSEPEKTQVIRPSSDDHLTTVKRERAYRLPINSLAFIHIHMYT